MTITIKRPAHQSADAASIENAERDIAIKLPKVYKQFLLQHNGGVPESNKFDVPALKTDSGISLFYGVLGSRTNGDLVYEQRRLRGRLPAGVVAVADAAGGNCVCVSLRSEDRGAVYFWDHELETEGDTAAALARIADSFDAFLELIQPFDPRTVKVEPSQVKGVWINPEFLEKLKRGMAAPPPPPSGDRT